MAQIITEKFLQAVCERINRATASPLTPYAMIGDKHDAQPGNYHISHAYGGVSLHRMRNTSGGIQDVFGCGHVTKRNLSERMFAFLNGLEAAK